MPAKGFQLAFNSSEAFRFDLLFMSSKRKMKKLKSLFLSLTLISSFSFAQINLNGKIIEAGSNNGIEGASVSLRGTGYYHFANAQGEFRIENIKAGNYQLVVGQLGFYSYEKNIVLRESQEMTIELKAKNLLAEEVIISAVRSAAGDAGTRSIITRDEIEKLNLGQDLPFMLQQATSVVNTSDAGAGVGYTGMSIRGSDATRINITINGVPLNDSESHGVFWVNMPDFASSISDMEIQRGVGTSSNGSASFGASVNIQTDTHRKDAYAETNHSLGSFNTMRNNLMVGSGLINNHFTFDARISRIQSDGFIDRASSNLNSNFLSGAYMDKKNLLKFNLISGSEKTYQAWNGIPESRLRGDREGMLDYISRNFLSSSDSAHLVNSGSRTFNQFTYNNQTDNYRQTHYQLFYSREVNSQLNLNTALHYTKGRGYYEEYKVEQNVEDYGLNPLLISDDTLSFTDLIRQRWLDNDFYGATYSLDYKTEKSRIIFGGSVNQYYGRHFGDIIWMQLSPLRSNEIRYYENAGLKNELNNYVKFTHRFNRYWSVFADVQWRNIYYSFEGFDQNLNLTTQSASFNFINPKAGVSFNPNDLSQAYLTYGRSQREPVRDDFVNSTPDSRPKAEDLHNLEAGYRMRNDKFSLAANYYLMYYLNQLVLVGNINDVGAFTRTNVDRSYRTGIELEGSYSPVRWLDVIGNISLSDNRILNYEHRIDDYDNGTVISEQFDKTYISYSPNYISGLTLNVRPVKQLEVGVLSKWVGRQYLDNTSSLEKSLNPYQFFNLRASYKINPTWIKEISLNVLVNNLLNAEYETNGYTFSYYAGGRMITENFYYPQAGRNFLAGVSLKF
jgi:iron complex outermembrane recepter protein